MALTVDQGEIYLTTSLYNSTYVQLSVYNQHDEAWIELPLSDLKKLKEDIDFYIGKIETAQK